MNFMGLFSSKNSSLLNLQGFHADHLRQKHARTGHLCKQLVTTHIYIIAWRQHLVAIVIIIEAKEEVRWCSMKSKPPVRASKPI